VDHFSRPSGKMCTMKTWTRTDSTDQIIREREAEWTDNKGPCDKHIYTAHHNNKNSHFMLETKCCCLFAINCHLRPHCNNDVQAWIKFKFDPDLSPVTISLLHCDSVLNVRWTQFDCEPSSEHGSNFDQSSTLFMRAHESEKSHDQLRHYTSSITSLSKTIVVLTTKLLLKIENMCFHILQNKRVDYWCEMRKQNHKIQTNMRYRGYTFVRQASHCSRIINC